MIGYITLFYGSMYSGKSEKLIWKLKRIEIAGKTVIMFKPAIDDRYAKSEVVTHNKEQRFPALNIANSSEILSYIDDFEKNEKEKVHTVGIDEVQFFDENIKNVVNTLVNKGINVVLSGLDMYSTGDPFPLTAHFACISKYVEKLHAVCVDCGNDAYISYKLDGSKKRQIDIGSKGKYVALCMNCNKIREKYD